VATVVYHHRDIKMAKCLGHCGKDIDGMCADCCAGAAILNKNAINNLRVQYKLIRAILEILVDTAEMHVNDNSEDVESALNAARTFLQNNP
jgi:hypothetical protein